MCTPSFGSFDFYFATKVSDNGNAQLFYQLVRNQLFLGLSCIWTLSVIDPQSDPTFFSTTVFDFSLVPVFLGIVSSVPLVAGGLAISRSQSRTWVDINSATNQLVKIGVCGCEVVWGGGPCVPGVTQHTMVCVFVRVYHIRHGICVCVCVGAASVWSKEGACCSGSFFFATGHSHRCVRRAQFSRPWHASYSR